MTEITLIDLTFWSGVEVRPLAGLSGHGLERPVSWIVGLRPAEPALPLLRDDELIVIPGTVVDQLEAEEIVNLPQVISFLSEQPIAGVIIDEPWRLGAQPPFPVLVSDAPLDAEAEMVFNREITRRRGDLYNLGANLARRLSTAAMRHASINEFLAAAAEVSSYEMMLVTRRGSLLGRSSNAPELAPVSVLQHLDATTIAEPIALDAGTWLVAPVEGGQVPGGLDLIVGPLNDGAPERARLAARQSIDALQVILDHVNPRRADPRSERNQVLQELVVGNLAPNDRRATDLLAGMSGEPPWRLILLAGQPPRTIIDILEQGAAPITAPAESGAQLTLVSAAIWNDLQGHEVISQEPIGIASPELTTIPEIVTAASELQAIEPLAQSGIFGAGIVVPDDPLSAGVAGLLIRLLGSDPRLWQRAGQFRDVWLDRLRAAERGGEFVQTAQAYLTNGGSLSDAAADLGVHRNTFAYRMTRIRETAGVDLADPDVQLSLRIALMLDVLIGTASDR